RGNPRFLFLFVANLTVGLAGFIALTALETSLSAQLFERSKDVLSADLAVHANRDLTEDEKIQIAKSLPSDAQISKQISLYSMVLGPGGSKLVQLVAVDQHYPFYGVISLEDKAEKNSDAEHSQKNASLLAAPTAWIYP